MSSILCFFLSRLNFLFHYCVFITCILSGKVVSEMTYTVSGGTFRSRFSIVNQIKFDLQFTDLRLTWCSELIVDQLCFVFPGILDLQLRDRRLADPLLTEPSLCQSDWLTVTSICGVALNYPACTASGR